MNCPYCRFKFNLLLANKLGGDPIDSEDMQLAPCVCEGCAQISLLDRGIPRKIEPPELEALKRSPAWGILSKAVDIVNLVNRRQRHSLN